MKSERPTSRLSQTTRCVHCRSMTGHATGKGKDKHACCSACWRNCTFERSIGDVYRYGQPEILGSDCTDEASEKAAGKDTSEAYCVKHYTCTMCGDVIHRLWEMEADVMQDVLEGHLEDDCGAFDPWSLFKEGASS